MKTAIVDIKAAAGRVILRFPKATEETQGGVAIPKDSQQRVELAEVIDVGAPLSEADVQHRAWLLERKENGDPVFASFAMGTEFYKRNYDDGKWHWLKDFRAYPLSHPMAYLKVEQESGIIADPTGIVLPEIEIVPR